MGATTTLLALPAQPSPKASVEAGAFVTIWAFVCFVFAYLFHRLLMGPNRLWPEFQHIRNSTLLLGLWYTITAIDRWLHYEQKALPYGYVLLEPCLQVLQVGSTIWFLSGTYIILWNELERRFEQPAQIALWLTAQFAVFIVILVSLYELVLDIAAPAVWLQFLSLNVIADVTSKRNSFEVAMTAFFTVFAALSLCVGIATLVYVARRREGTSAWSRLYLVLAMGMLFGRSLAECIIASQTASLNVPRLQTQLSYDISFGLLTSLYLIFMHAQALQLLSKNDTGRSDVEDIQSDIRVSILEQLWAVTDHKKLTAPSPVVILDKTLQDLDTILENGPRSRKSTLSLQQKERHARRFIAKLRREMARFEPQAPVVPKTTLAANAWGGRNRQGRQTAPLPQASSMYHSLVDAQAHPAMRTAHSVPNMRKETGSPFARNQFYGPDIRQLEMQRIEEDLASKTFTRRPVGQPRHMSANLEEQSFQARANAAGLRERDGYRAALNPIPRQRRQYAPQPVEEVDESEVPESYTPQIQPEVESGTTLAGPSEETPWLYGTVEMGPQGRRRRFQRGAAPLPTTTAPTPLSAAEDLALPFDPSPVDTGYCGFQTPSPGPFPRQDYDDRARPQPQPQLATPMPYAETVTDTEPSTRSPVNWDFELPDLERAGTQSSNRRNN